MIHEIILSLLGFCGDIIIESSNTYKVSDNFDLLLLSEREQINRIVPLGWYYNSISKYAQRHEAQWGSSTTGFQVYKSALCFGINDFLEEYLNDVSTLESLFCENPFPVSYLLTSMQKYTIVMPALQAICTEIEERRLKGCQILDHLAKFRSGIPLVNDTVTQ